MRGAVFRPRGRLRPRRPLEVKPIEERKASRAPYFLAGLAALLIIPFLLGISGGPGGGPAVVIQGKGGEIGSVTPQPEQPASAVRYDLVPAETPSVPAKATVTGSGGQQQQQGVVIVL